MFCNFFIRSFYIFFYLFASVTYVILGKEVTYIPAAMILFVTSVVGLVFPLLLRLWNPSFSLIPEDKKLFILCIIDVGDVIGRTLCVYFINVDFAIVLLAAEAPWGLLWKRKKRPMAVYIIHGLIIIGVLITSFGSHERGNFTSVCIGVAFALASTNCRVLVNVVAEKILAENESPFHQYLFYVSAFNMLVAIPMSIFSYKQMKASYILPSVSMALIMVFGIMFAFLKSCEPGRLPVSTNLTIRTTQLPIIYMAAYVFLGEVPNGTQIFGACIVFMLCAMDVFVERPIAPADELVKFDGQPTPLTPLLLPNSPLLESKYSLLY